MSVPDTNHKSIVLTMLSSAVETHHGRRREADGRAVLDEAAAPRNVLIAEEADSLLRDMRRTPEVDLEKVAGDLVGDAFRLSRKGVPGVVEDDVAAAEHLLGLSEGRLDLGGLGDVEAGDEQLIGGVLRLELVEDLGLAEGRDDAVAVRKGAAGHLEAEARGGAGDCKNRSG